MLVYKIKSTKTGLFSKGGSTPSFSKTGKVWTNIGHVRNHINVLDNHGHRIYREQEVELVTYEIAESIVDVTTLDELLVQQANNQAQRDAERKSRADKWLKEQRLKMYQELQKEFER